MKKRVLSLITILCLLFALLPTTAFAADSYGYSSVHGIESNKTYCGDTYFTLDIPAEHLIEVAYLRADNGSSYMLWTDEYGYYKLDAGLGAIDVVVRWQSSIMRESIHISNLTVNAQHTDETPKDHECDICGKTISTCSGGTATCKDNAVCKYCGKPYGEVDSNNHDLEYNKEKAATVTETGNIEYWHCKDCGNNFSDEDGKTAIDLKDTVTPKLPPEIIDGKGQSLTAGETRELTFRSNAAYSDFIRVEVDGETVDGKNYTVKEGSTIVTLKADYVATLSAGEHTLGIVSESGTATTTFTVNAKVVNDNTAPQTGDNSHMTLWFALLFVSGGALIGTIVYGKKKKYSVK